MISTSRALRPKGLALGVALAFFSDAGFLTDGILDEEDDDEDDVLRLF